MLCSAVAGLSAVMDVGVSMLSPSLVAVGGLPDGRDAVGCPGKCSSHTSFLLRALFSLRWAAVSAVSEPKSHLVSLLLPGSYRIGGTFGVQKSYPYVVPAARESVKKTNNQLVTRSEERRDRRDPMVSSR